MTSEDEEDQALFGILLILVLVSAPLILTLITMMQLFRAVMSIATRFCHEENPSGDDAGVGGNSSLEDGEQPNNVPVEQGRSESSLDQLPSPIDSRTSSRMNSILLGHDL